jgi:hypothetical protein
MELEMNPIARIVEAVKNAWRGSPETPLREAVGFNIDADEESWRKLSDDSARDLSPLSQARMRDTAVYLWDANLLANRIVELQNAYLLGEGVELRAKEKELQEVIDKFWRDPINQMDIKLPEKTRELSIYGEQCWPVFVNEVSGHVRLGYLDPGHIAKVVMDPDNPEQPIGIVTVKDKKGQYRKYRVIVNGDDAELFTARTAAIRENDFTDGECFLFQINKLTLTHRGRSDLRAPADWVDGYDQFLYGELERYSFLRAFFYDVTLTGATEEGVVERAKKIRAPKSGSVRVHNESEAWAAVSPDVKAGDTADGARLFRNHVLGGATIPEHWFGGGGDVNRAVGAEMGEPTFKVMSLRQRFIKHILETVGTFVLRKHLMARESEALEWFDERVVTEAVFPEMTSRDTTKYAAALAQLVTGCSIAVEKGLMTEESAVKLIASVAGRLGVEIDPEDELTKARKARAERAANDTFPPAGDTGDLGGAGGNTPGAVPPAKKAPADTAQV